MKKAFAIIGALLVMAGALSYFLWDTDSQTSETTSPSEALTTEPEGPVAVEISMTTDGYAPNETHIKNGQAIRFTNDSDKPLWPASNIHPTHDIYPEFDPGRALEPGESWTFTFRRSGLWRMHDHLLPYIKGSITVE